MSEISENCEFYIFEGFDVECEKIKDDKDLGKLNGEDKVKIDFNDIKEIENVDLDMVGNNS